MSVRTSSRKITNEEKALLDLFRTSNGEKDLSSNGDQISIKLSGKDTTYSTEPID
ncbi:MAG: hypothetical protein MHPSP_004563, partial [Paramarteilia canceri]